PPVADALGPRVRRSRRHRQHPRTAPRRLHCGDRSLVKAVIRLLWTFIVRPLRRDLIRTALTLVSVALGVAVVIAIELAGEAAVGSFRSSLETLLGKTDLQVTANGG